MVSSPVQNLKQKLRGRPSYLDEGHSRSWKIQPQQVLACLVLTLILVSVGFAFLISYKHFDSEERNKDPLNGKYRAIQFGRVGSGKNQVRGEFENRINKLTNEDIVVSDVDLNFLLDDDVTIEEVDKIKIELEGKVNSPEPSTDDSSKLEEAFTDVEAVVILKQLAKSVKEVFGRDKTVGEEVSGVFDENLRFKGTKNEVLIENSGTKNKPAVSKPASTKKKSKNANPLNKSVP